MDKITGLVDDRFYPLGYKKNNRDIPALRKLKKIHDINLVYEVAISFPGNKNKISKKATLYICHRFSGKTLTDIGVFFGIGESAVSLASSRFKQILRWNIWLRKNIDTIIEKLDLQIV